MKKAGTFKGISIDKYEILFFLVKLSIYQQNNIIKKFPKARFITSSQYLKIKGEKAYPRIKILQKLLK